MQAKTFMDKSSGAADEGGRSDVGQDEERGTRSCTMEETRWWPVLQYRSNKGVCQSSQSR